VGRGITGQRLGGCGLISWRAAKHGCGERDPGEGDQETAGSSGHTSMSGS
jgi:hypothetical protein